MILFLKKSYLLSYSVSLCQTVGWTSISSAPKSCPMTVSRTFDTSRRCTAATWPRWSKPTTPRGPWWLTCAYRRSRPEVRNCVVCCNLIGGMKEGTHMRLHVYARCVCQRYTDVHRQNKSHMWERGWYNWALVGAAEDRILLTTIQDLSENNLWNQ